MRPFALVLCVIVPSPLNWYVPARLSFRASSSVYGFPRHVERNPRSALFSCDESVTSRAIS